LLYCNGGLEAERFLYYIGIDISKAGILQSIANNGSSFKENRIWTYFALKDRCGWGAGFG
jgi:hypothetical protein